MLHLRAIVPADRTDAVCEALAECSGAADLVVLPGAARSPSGDVVTSDVARESANEVLDALCHDGRSWWSAGLAGRASSPRGRT